MGRHPAKHVSSITRRRTNLCRAIELAYDSASSHFAGAVKQERHKEYTGDPYFNAKTIREYMEICLICSVELEFLAKEEKSRKRKNLPITHEHATEEYLSE